MSVLLTPPRECGRAKNRIHFPDKQKSHRCQRLFLSTLETPRPKYVRGANPFPVLYTVFSVGDGVTRIQFVLNRGRVVVRYENIPDPSARRTTGPNQIMT